MGGISGDEAGRTIEMADVEGVKVSIAFGVTGAGGAEDEVVEEADYEVIDDDNK